MKKTILAVTCLVGLLTTGCASMNDVNNAQSGGFIMEESMVKGKTFVVTHVNDTYLSDSVSATMLFGEDGRISGRGFCNLYMGTYSLNDNNLLETNKVLSTKRACEDERQGLEKDLNLILGHKMSFSDSELGYKVTSDVGSFQIMELVVEEYKKK